jgi:hypothetical protein
MLLCLESGGYNAEIGSFVSRCRAEGAWRANESHRLRGQLFDSDFNSSGCDGPLIRTPSWLFARAMSSLDVSTQLNHSEIEGGVYHVKNKTSMTLILLIGVSLHQYKVSLGTVLQQ